MKIGILTHGFMNWSGGIDFLSATIQNISSSNKEHEFHVFVSSRGWKVNFYNLVIKLMGKLFSFIGVRIPKPVVIDGAAVIQMIQGLQCKCLIYEVDIGYKKIEFICRLNGIQILLPSIKPLPGNFSIPWIGYIADFQHKHLPDNFNSYELHRRDSWFDRMISVAPAIIVNSNQTLHDAIKFHGVSVNKLVKLPFYASPNDEWFDILKIAEYESLVNTGFFLICNQFWKHKGYEVAFRALSILAEFDDKVLIVCTGSTSDNRDEYYFPQLLQLIDDLNISHRIKILGLIPKPHQIYLMRNSLALVQPTFFEGGPGGGSVFDAISLGVPCVISDIEVNLELNEYGISFFESGNPTDLALVMSNFLTSRDWPYISDDELRSAGKKRRQHCGAVLLEAMTKVVLEFDASAHQRNT